MHHLIYQQHCTVAANYEIWFDVNILLLDYILFCFESLFLLMILIL